MKIKRIKIRINYTPKFKVIQKTLILIYFSHTIDEAN